MINRIKFPLIASLTLGLAPFLPEPHIYGKLKWIFGGGVGMQPMDWFDAAFHGLPWLWLIGTFGYALFEKYKNEKTS
jgi:hypothetical protein